jgi:hypothetical protein
MEPASTITISTTTTASTTTTISSPAASASHSGYIRTLGYDLQVSTTEDAFIQDEGLRNEAWLGEFDVRVPLGLAGELVQEDGDTIDRSSALEVGLNLLGGSTIVDVPYENASSIDILTIFAELMTLLIETGLHLTKLGGFFLHLSDTALHGLDLLLFIDLFLSWMRIFSVLGRFNVCHYLCK